MASVMAPLGAPRRRWLLAAAAAVILLVCTSGVALWRQPAALIVPEVVNLGGVGPTTHRHPIHIQNNTRNTVRITDVKTSCGCTAANFAIPVDLAPGRGIDGEVVLDATRKVGRFEERIAFYTDQPHDPVRVVVVQGFVNDAGEPLPQPASVRLGRFGSWESPERTVKIMSGSRTELNVIATGVTPAGSRAEVVERHSNHLVLMLRLDGHSLPQGPFSYVQTVPTTQGDVRFTVEGEQAGRLYALERVLVVSAAQSPTVRKAIRVRHEPDYPIHALQARSSDWDANCVGIEPIDASTSDLVLDLAARSDGQLAGRGNVSLFLPTADEPVERVQIVVLP